jgi:hypothetical protein
MTLPNMHLERIELLGKGVRAYRVVMPEPLEPTAELPEPEQPELTDNARQLGKELRERANFFSRQPVQSHQR